MGYDLHIGNAIDILAEMPDQSVNCCVTSPPYWGLRDYKTDPVIFGGSSSCEHKWTTERVYREIRAGKGLAEFSKQYRGGGHKQGKVNEVDIELSFCSSCGAWKGQLGLEPTPEMFVEHLVEIFREVNRVLCDGGTIWVNMGDSYAASRSYQVSDNMHKAVGPTRHLGRATPPAGYKQKDLVGVPWMLAFALRADGWFLRQDIIWSKTNCMPESVKDRCTKAHEYLFLLSKSRLYYYDHEAIKEPMVYGNSGSGIGFGHGTDKECRKRERWKVPQGWDTDKGSHGNFHKKGRRPKGNAKTFRGGGAYTRGRSFNNSEQVERESHGNAPSETGLRNKRTVWTVEDHNSLIKWLSTEHPDIAREYLQAAKPDVWTVATQPFKGAHFATFPEKLIEPCILAGCPEGGMVLDPFAGAGTTGVVAMKHFRNFIGIELNPEYANDIAIPRLEEEAGRYKQLQIA